MEVLRNLTSITAAGRRVDASRLAEEIRIGSPDILTPEGVVLVDTPGFNDNDALTQKALSAAKQADLIVWVLSSRQFLSMVEQDVMRQLYSYRGPHGFCFVVNTFLSTTSPTECKLDWEIRQREDFPRQTQILHEFHQTLGIDAPPLICVSARTASEIDSVEYGVVRLRERIFEIISRDRDILSALRKLAAALAHVRLLRQQLGEDLKKEQFKYEQMEQTRRSYANWRNDYIGFCTHLSDIASRAIDKWLNETSSIGAQQAELVTEEIKRDNTYSECLRLAFQRISSQVTGNLLNDLNNISSIYSMKFDTFPSLGQITDLFAVEAPSVEVADNGGLGGGAAVGAATGRR